MTSRIKRIRCPGLTEQFWSIPWILPPWAEHLARIGLAAECSLSDRRSSWSPQQFPVGIQHQLERWRVARRILSGTNNYGSEGPKNLRILWIWIRNIAFHIRVYWFFNNLMGFTSEKLPYNILNTISKIFFLQNR